MENQKDKNKYEYVNGKVLDVSEVEVEVLPTDHSKITRIKLKTNEGVISYRPFKEIEELSMVQGYKIRKKRRELLNMVEMPLKIQQINETIKNKGTLCKIKAYYTLWRKVVDNNVEVYRYMRNSDIEKIEILPLDEKIVNTHS